MSKTKKILTALCVLSASIGGYLFYSVEIFEEPYVVFSGNGGQSFSPLDSRCSQSREPVAPLASDRLRLLVWNIHKGKDEGWQATLRTYARQADFLLLQEVTNRQQLHAQISDRFSTALYVAAFSYLGETSGVNILARAEPDLFCAGMEKEPWILIPKVGAALRFPLKNGRSLLVVNLHLVNFEINPTNYRKQIETMMEPMAEHDGPIILAGDFNTWNGERSALVRELARRAGLEEVRYQPDYRLRFFGDPLDHVFVRGFNVIRATTEQTASSDHNPLWLELAFD